MHVQILLSNEAAVLQRLFCGKKDPAGQSWQAKSFPSMHDFLSEIAMPCAAHSDCLTLYFEQQVKSWSL